MTLSETILKEFREREDSNIELALHYSKSNTEEAILHLRLAATWKLAIKIVKEIDKEQKGVKIGIGGIGITTGTVNFPGICNCGHLKGSMPMCNRTDCNQKIDL